ncbi:MULTISPECIES: hypothetical protein [Pontibacillus]|uniref:Uncharacterized protein n=1 Tax=Pontibacillus chungwhensis TaxID=265426 RepID=A0ABY8UYS5_9BACI|nr:MULTISPECIES: hypothetical protein [Pontibacillus]MCD5325538.1 hypothetical protein [Pontibacillus sp. HN14]WIF98647.1 hypothetical protein QNI29_02975 [Pontibacillus chungwhensis]
MFMEHLGDLSGFRRECIDAQKVFDYVIVNLEGTDNAVRFFPSNGLTAADICPILDAGGRLANIQTDVVIPEEGGCSVEVDGDEVVEIDGEEVTLQWVTVTKDEPLTFRISFDVVDENGCVVGSACGTSLIRDIAQENLLLCAPEGTTVACTLLPSTSIRPYNFRCVGDPIDLRFSVRYNLCQAIQSYDQVKLEVFARLCQPRPIISPVDTCQPIVPQQCPAIFPGTMNMNGSDS